MNLLTHRGSGNGGWMWACSKYLLLDVFLPIEFFLFFWRKTLLLLLLL
jgi:hypothetical protein